MTEEEAKTKVCHRVIGPDDNRPKVVGDPQFIKGHVCIGSACMAWRSVMETRDFAGGSEGRLVNYCGLAGKP